MTFDFKMESLPVVDRAGRYPLADRDFSTSYLNARTNALHIYDYSGRIMISGRHYDISPGTMTITPIGVDARYDLEKPGFHYCTHFMFPESRRGYGEVLGISNCMNLGPARAAAESKFMNLIWWMQQSEKSHEAGKAASLVLQEFLVWLHWVGNTQEAGAGRKAMNAVAGAAMEMDRRMEEQVRIPDVCRIAGLSQNYLAVLFRRQYGMTMGRYLIKRRVEYAKHLLECTAIPVKEIGARVGIPDPQHFNKLFRKICGKSPSGFRNSSS